MKKLKRKRKSIESLFTSGKLCGKWINLELPKLVELHIDSSDILLVERVANTIVKVVIHLDDGEEFDTPGLEEFLRVNSLSFQLSIDRKKKRRTRIKDKLRKKSPEDAIRSYMSRFPPMRVYLTLSKAIECLIDD